MFVLITYDVNMTSMNGAKRLRNVARVCRDYGRRVQNSVFECLLTEAQLVILKKQLNNIIDVKQDSIRIYILGKSWKNKVENIGRNTGLDFSDELIL